MAPPTNDKLGRTIRSVEIAFEILDVIRNRSGVGVTEVSEELGYAKSTVHNHLRTLEEQQIIVREGDGYRLSVRILDMAAHVREQIGNHDVIQDEVDKLADKTGEIAHFAVVEFNGVTYFYKATGDESVETASRVGRQQPLHSTALGKTLLAYLPDKRTNEIVDAIEFTPKTPNTATDPETLRAELDAIRERGYGIDDEENIEGLRCVAAPVRADERVLGAVSISGPSSRFTDDRIHGELSEYVQRAANVIELNTKFS
jgi:DNA-binding IclR family transcriptional regulator